MSSGQKAREEAYMIVVIGHVVGKTQFEVPDQGRNDGSKLHVREL